MIRRLLQPLLRPCHRFLDNRLLKISGLTAMGQFTDQDVFITSYPRSGNTWFRSLAVGVVYGIDTKVAPRILLQDLVPGTDFRPVYRRYAKACLFKTHDLPKPEYRRVVYLLRDGRDAMVSYHQYFNALNGKTTLREMIETGKDVYPCEWKDHVEAWMSNPHKAEMLVIRYEDLKNDGVREVKRFCEFYGVEREERILQDIVANAAFERMKEAEVRDGPVGENWDKSKFFVRRGQVGSYKDEMPPEVLEIFAQRAGATLRKYGYP